MTSKKDLQKILRSGWTNMKRNSYLSFGATGTIALTLFLFLGLLALQFLSNQTVTALRDKVDVSAYFKQNASEDQILAVKADLEKNNLVSEVTYVSRDQALQDFSNRHQNDQIIQDSLAQLDDNPLQASLNIKGKDSSQYATIVKFIEGSRFKESIDKINFYENQAVIGKIQSIAGGIKNWGLLSTLLLGLIAALVTFNTIRLTIYNQKQEIEIMRLVGASNWYIRGPYLAEGGLYGVFAGAVAIILFYPVIYLISDNIAAFASGVDLFAYFAANILQVGSLTFGLGMALGIVSSSVTISRHLKI